jgi:hypothetical protein
MLKHNLYKTSFAKVYPYYIAKAEKKGRTKAEVNGEQRVTTARS